MARGQVIGDPAQVAGLLHRFEPILRPDRIGQDFLTRLVLQKSVYLIEDWGAIPFGYSFHWWHRGPYSSALARDTFAALPLYPSAAPRRFSDDDVERRFSSILSWLANRHEPAEWFELMGSARFLVRRGFPREEAMHTLSAKLPMLKRQDLDTAWDLVSNPPPIPAPAPMTQP